MMSLADEKFDVVAGFTNIEVSTPLELKIPEPVNEEEAYYYGTRGR